MTLNLAVLTDKRLKKLFTPDWIVRKNEFKLTLDRSALAYRRARISMDALRGSGDKQIFAIAQARCKAARRDHNRAKLAYQPYGREVTFARRYCMARARRYRYQHSRMSRTTAECNAMRQERQRRAQLAAINAQSKRGKDNA